MSSWAGFAPGTQRQRLNGELTKHGEKGLIEMVTMQVWKLVFLCTKTNRFEGVSLSLVHKVSGHIMVRYAR